MPDLLSEGAIGTAGAAKWLNQQVKDARYSPIAIWRFMRKGSIGVNGQRVCLEYIKLGRRFMTSAAALSRFAARLAATNPDTPPNNKSKQDLERSDFYR